MCISMGFWGPFVREFQNYPGGSNHWLEWSHWSSWARSVWRSSYWPSDGNTQPVLNTSFPNALSRSSRLCVGQPTPSLSPYTIVLILPNLHQLSVAASLDLLWNASDHTLLPTILLLIAYRRRRKFQLWLKDWCQPYSQRHGVGLLTPEKASQGPRQGPFKGP